MKGDQHQPRVSYSPQEYAARHGVSTRTVQRWIKEGKLNVLRFSPRTVRIVPRSVLREDSATLDDTRRAEATQP